MAEAGPTQHRFIQKNNDPVTIFIRTFTPNITYNEYYNIAMDYVDNGINIHFPGVDSLPLEDCRPGFTECYFNKSTKEGEVAFVQINPGVVDWMGISYSYNDASQPKTFYASCSDGTSFNGNCGHDNWRVAFSVIHLNDNYIQKMLHPSSSTETGINNSYEFSPVPGDNTSYYLNTSSSSLNTGKVLLNKQGSLRHLIKHEFNHVLGLSHQKYPSWLTVFDCMDKVPSSELSVMAPAIWCTPDSNLSSPTDMLQHSDINTLKSLYN